MSRIRSKRRGVHGSLSDRAYNIVRDKILKGELPLGAILSRRTLAQEFGMSFLPVSEALQRLENDGLVESKPRVGTRVRIPTTQDIRERYVVREALETQSARLFAEKASSQEKRELRSMAEKVDELFAACDSDDQDPDFIFNVHRYHSKFHMRISECTGCTALRDAIEKNQVLIFNWLYDTAANRPSLPSHFHVELVEAMSSGDPEKADAVMRCHVRYGIERVISTLERQLNSDGWRLARTDAHLRNPKIAKR